jgi:hypothetical protein
MLRIRLSEEDTTRLGCPQELTFEYGKMMGRDLLELEEQVGWSIDQFERQLEGVPAVNALGGPIYEMDGDKPKLDGGGKPILAMTYTTKTVMVLVWMCVRRANPDVAWKTFDFDVTAAEIDNDDEEEVGKAPSRANSKKSTTGTSRRSRASSASRRGTNATS